MIKNNHGINVVRLKVIKYILLLAVFIFLYLAGKFSN